MSGADERPRPATTGAPLPDGPRRRSPGYAAIGAACGAYVSALLLVLCLSEAVMLAAGAVRSGGGWERSGSEALRFTRTAPGVMSSAVVSAMVFALVAIVAARLESRDVVGRLGLRASRASGVGVAAATVGMMGLSVASGAATDLVGVRDEGTMKIVAHALERPDPPTFVLALLTLALAPGVSEEMLFRGFIQRRLAVTWRPAPSILATAVAFGLIHLDAVQGSLALLAGIYLGWVAQRFGGIRPSIAAHAVNNAAFVAAATLGSSYEATSRGDLIGIAVGTVLCAASCAVLSSPVAIGSHVEAP